MALSVTTVVAGQPVRTAHITQFFDLFTGAMTDQPVTFKNLLTLTRSAAGAPSSLPYLTVTGAADTLVNAEASDVFLNLSRTLQFSGGSAPSTQRAVRIDAPTYSASSAAVITNAATLAVANAPGAGANMTITNAYALWVQAGQARFDGGVKVGAGSVILANAALATNATSGFLYVASCAGRPTGTPDTNTGTMPLVMNSTDDRGYFYSTNSTRWMQAYGKPPRVYVRRTATQAISANTETNVTFDASSTEDVDTDGFHSSGSNPTRLTVPTGCDGLYYFYAYVSFAANTSGDRFYRVYKNDNGSFTANNRVAETMSNRVAVGGGDGAAYVGGVVPMVAGDYLELAVYSQTSALNLTNLGQYATGFGMVRLAAN